MSWKRGLGAPLLAFLTVAVRHAASASFSYFAAEGTPVSISFGLDGNLYYLNYNSRAIGVLRPDGSSETIEISSTHRYGGLVTGPDGSLWFTDGWSLENEIGRYLPGPGGGFSEFTLPTPNAQPLGIAAGPDGNMWFVEGNACNVGRITPSGLITEYPVPSSPRGCGFNDIALGPDGALWATDSAGRIVRVSSDGRSITPYPTPNAHPPGRIVLGPDGALWFLEVGSGSDNQALGRIGADGSVTEFVRGLLDNCCFNALALGPDGAFWIGDDYFVRLARVTTAGAITWYSPSRQVLSLATGRDGALWMALNQTNAESPKPIGRLVPVIPGDANGDGRADISDIFYLINFLFAGGPAPTQ